VGEEEAPRCDEQTCNGGNDHLGQTVRTCFNSLEAFIAWRAVPEISLSRGEGETAGAIELLDEALRREIIKEGYVALTRVQELSIPKVLSGKHTIIVAPTGSGKTEAAIFPILSEMLKQGYRKRISVLYITPLRALNRDIMRRVETISGRLGVEVAVRHGDTPASLRKASSLRPPHILITTPETFAYILVNPRLREALKNVKWVVVDELHELLESKRGSQVAVNLERLVEIAGNFQRIGLSASIGDIETAKKFLAYGRHVEEVVVEGVRDMEIYLVADYHALDPSKKIEAVAELVRKHGSSVVFTNTRDEAELIGRKLAELGLSVRVHHGSLSRDEREETEKLLKEGSLSCVVATSSLELGIDVGSVDAVIQISSPRQVSKLIQRVGRARHGPGKKALGYVVCDASLDDVVESAVIIRRATAGLIERSKPYKNPYDVLIHTLVGMALEGEYDLEKAYKVVSRSYSFAELTLEEFNQLVNKAVEFGYIRIHDGNKLRSTPKGKIYYMTTTTIVDTASYDVVDALTRRTIGSLDEEFVVELEDGAKLVLGGRLWKVVSVDPDSSNVYVEELTEGEALIPSWTGETIPVDYKVSREVCGVLRIVGITGRIPPQYASFMGEEAKNYIEKVVAEHKRSGYPIPSDNLIVVEYVDSDKPLLVLSSCLGTKGNRGLAFLLLHRLSMRYGISPAYKVDPYRVIVEMPYRLPPHEVLGEISNIFGSANPVEDLTDGIKRSRLFDLLLFNVGRRLGIIPKEVEPRIAKTIMLGIRNDEVVAGEAVKEGLTRYVDPDVVVELVRRVRGGKARVVPVIGVKLSPIAMEGLKDVRIYERVRGGTIPRGLVAEIVRRRILEKEVLLICLHCGYSWVSKVKDLEDRVSCKRCGYGLVGVSKVVSDDAVRIVRKAVRLGKNYKFRLGNDELEIFERLMDSAVLVLDYGKKAVEALAAYGVGPESAKKALQYDGDDFYLKLYELEKQFVRTRKFWG